MRRQSRSALAPGALLVACLLGAAGETLGLPPGFIETDVASGWDEPVGLTFASDGRMFVWERKGKVWIVEGGVKQPTPFIDLRDEVGGWRDYGLLGFALHPNFYANGFVYLLYVVDHHHLIHAGTPAYNPNTDEYFMATIGRLTRYTARVEDDRRSVDYASRLVLIGETISTGFPIVHQSHGTGSLVFGTDGMLLGACGDGASYSTQDTGGPVGGTYVTQALAEGILSPKEDVGAYRSQLVDCLNGKVFRIDPLTGDGVPSNPFFDPADPRAPRSRVWALGLRNPCRMTLRPGTGSHDPDDADPGSLYIGDVGYGTWEDLHVATAPGQNFGWPAFEGLEAHGGYYGANTLNRDAPNPLFGTGGCTQEFFYFRNLIIQDTLNPSPSFPNPCNPAQQIPVSIPRFVHTRPVIDWRHGAGPSRTGIYSGQSAAVINLGASGSPVSGPQFGGNCSIGGAWYTDTEFPPEFRNTYFHCDYGASWLRNFRFDASDKPVEVKDFHSGTSYVALAAHPTDGALYYVSWSSTVRKITYAPTGNQAPAAVASLDRSHGPAPLVVQFQGSSSTDPEGQTLTYSWNFGDGTAASPLANPAHTFTAPAGVPTRYNVTLTVTDPGGASATASLIVSVNNTPPAVNITSPADGTLYPLTGDTTYTLAATITDAEHGPGQRTCRWQTTLHHNEHSHDEPADTSCATSAVISPVGCNGETYYYRITLTVTDAAGLSGSDQVLLYPDCPNQPPLARADAAVVAQGHARPIDVLANDTDADGAIVPGTVSVSTPPARGTTSIHPSTGAITYTHDGSATASDSFFYTVADDDGAVSSAARVTITTFNNPPSVVLLSPAPADVFTVGGSVALAASGSDPEDGTDVDYHWEIDRLHNNHLDAAVFVRDGPSPPAFVVPAHGAAGDRLSYLVRVRVTDIAGAVAMDSEHVLAAVPPPNQAPIPLFSANPFRGTAPLAVVFDAIATLDLDGDYLLYAWDFGDSSGVASGLSAAYTYNLSGNRVATLTVTDAGGASASAAMTIEALAPGLEGTYYNNANLTTPVLTRVDPAIDFDWGSGSPDAAVGADTFSARWVGTIRPRYTQNYTLYAVTDDGFRLWIDGALVIDSWIDQSPTERSGTRALQAEVRHAITIEYYENGGGAVARLLWSSASQPKEVVPASRLAPPPPANTAPIAGAGPDRTVAAGAALLVKGRASDDGLPAGSSLGALWTSVSGPGTPVWPFGDADELLTRVVFPIAGTYVLRLTASDGQLQGSDQVTVTVSAPDPCVSDATPPVVTCPGPALTRFAGCQAPVPDLRGSVTASDNCTATPGLVLTQSPAPGTMLAAGTHTVTVTARDAGGNQASCAVSWTAEDRGFIRGNLNNRAAHLLDLGDVVDLINNLFGGFNPGFDCAGAFDVNNDGSRNIIDVVALVQGVLRGAYVMPPPGPPLPALTVPDGGIVPSILGCADGESCP